jgi:hypothetical protein
MSRQQAEELLAAAGGKVGFYVVRSGRGGGAVVVSLVHAGGIGHYNIEAKGKVGIAEIKRFVRSVSCSGLAVWRDGLLLMCLSLVHTHTAITAKRQAGSCRACSASTSHRALWTSSPLLVRTLTRHTMSNGTSRFIYLFFARARVCFYVFNTVKRLNGIF